MITKHLCVFVETFLEFLAATHPACDDSTCLSRRSWFGADDFDRKKELLQYNFMCGVISS